MKYLSRQSIASVLFVTALSVLVACKRDALLHNLPEGQNSSASNTSALEANGNSPAAHIAASESLAIPASVSLPENLPNGNARVATYFAEVCRNTKPGSRREATRLYMSGYW